MNKTLLQQEFLKFMSNESVLVDEPMAKHTSFKIGGPADILLLPKSAEEIQKIILVCNEKGIPFFTMGNGSNLLVTDKGLRSVVIKIADNLNKIEIMDNLIKAEAGILLSTLSKKALQESLGGLEFASGIPGTLGGAVTMNAGAYGGEMKDVVKSCRAMDLQGNIHQLDLQDMEMGYRTSIIQKNKLIVLDVIMELTNEAYEKIKGAMDELTVQRTTKQPLHLPSAGSVFKRPTGHFAGKLIQDSDLKGFRIGGAQVSDLHCGFIVNVGKATANDVLSLIKHIQKEVEDRFGVLLETEIRVVGEE